MPNEPYSIGSSVWPGLSKLIEECGEVLQVAGKIIGAGGAYVHWDGSNLVARLQEELADVLAAVAFLIEVVPRLDRQAIDARAAEKLARFKQWHTAPKS